MADGAAPPPPPPPAPARASLDNLATTPLYERSFEDLEALANGASGTTVRSNISRAQQRAKDLRVFEYDTDHRGVRITSSARPFSMRATHREIGCTSTSLALFLNAAAQLGVLALALALASLYSLVVNVIDNQFTSTYVVSGTTAAGLATNVTCSRPYTTHGPVLRSSQGSRCAIGDLESFFNCPMTCVVDSNVAFETSETCETHYPCQLKDVLTNAQYAKCCMEVLENTATSTPKEFQGIQTVVTILFLLFEFFYTRNQQETATSIISATVTAGDYSVYVDGFGKGNVWSRREVADFFAHYGEVVSVCHLTNTHKIVILERKIQTLLNIRNELETRMFDEYEQREKSSRLGFLREWLFRMIVLRGMKANEESIDNIERKIALAKREIAKFDGDNSKSVHLGMAVVTFNYEQHATNCCDDHESDNWERLSRFFTGRYPPDFRGRKLLVRRAPEPSDINWQHLRARRSKSRIIMWEIASYLTLGAALTVGGLVQYYFERIRFVELAVINQEVALTSAASFASQVHLQVLTAGASVVTVFINYVLDSLTIFLTSRETHITKTDANNVLLIKITVVQLLNYVVVPILTNRCSTQVDGACNWYTPGGLIEFAFYLQLFNILALPVRMMQLGNKFFTYVLAPRARTFWLQEKMYEPKEFDLSRQYSELLKIIGLAAIYGPALPVSYALAVIGIVVCYWCNKYSGLRMTKPPPKLHHSVFGVKFAIRIISLLQILFGCLVFYKFDSEVTVTLWVNLGIWIFALMPIRRLMGFWRPPELTAQSTGNVSFVNNAGLCDSHGRLRSMQDRKSVVEMPELRENEVETVPESRSEAVQKAFLARMYKCLPNELHKGRLNLYHPPVPTHAAPKQLEAILKQYEPFEEVIPANPYYLPGQLEHTGGKHTEEPSKHAKSEKMKLNILQSFNRRRVAMETQSGDGDA